MLDQTCSCQCHCRLPWCFSFQQNFVFESALQYQGVSINTSTAATRFFSFPEIKRCEITPTKLRESPSSQLCLDSGGKNEIIRSSAWLALLACNVAKHRCPVSA